MSNGTGAGQSSALAQRKASNDIVPTDQGWAVLVDQARTALASGFLPKSIRTPEQAIAIAMAGREIGLPVMASMRLISIIEGKPVVGAEAMVGLVHARVPGARLDVVKSDDQGAVVEAQRPGGNPARFTFTIADAQKANLAGKDNWRKYPATMCRWRALMNACRAMFAEVTLGVVLPDEAEEIAASNAQSVRAATAPIDVAAPAEPARTDVDGLLRDIDAVRDCGAHTELAAVAARIRGLKDDASITEPQRKLIGARYREAQKAVKGRAEAPKVQDAEFEATADSPPPDDAPEPGSDG